MPTKHKYSVKTLDNSGLHKACLALNKAVENDFVPSVIIGIRSGGFVVAEIMAREAENQPVLLAISRQRASTQTKSKVKGLKSILRLMPYSISDQLRICEHQYLMTKTEVKPQPFTPDAKELSELQKLLREKKDAKILIVDDAVDSGETMKAVLDLVRAEADSACIIKTAAITVTTDSPIIKPDYVLYHYVLCRFPWSFDFKS